MKTEIIIQFNIIEFEDKNRRDDELKLTVFSVLSPEKENMITQEELQKSGIKKMIQPKMECEYIPDKVGKKYTFKINAEQLKALLDLTP